MKKHILITGIILLTLALIFVFPDFLSAQPPPPPSKPTQTPIDGGLGILAVAGGAYAIKKLRERKK